MRLGASRASRAKAPNPPLLDRCAQDTVDTQLPSGMVPDIAPEYTVFSGGFRDSPEWGSE